jgi:hypothetical protein
LGLPAENHKGNETEEDEDTSQDPTSNAVEERLSVALSTAVLDYAGSDDGHQHMFSLKLDFAC